MICLYEMPVKEDRIIKKRYLFSVTDRPSRTASLINCELLWPTHKSPSLFSKSKSFKKLSISKELLCEKGEQSNIQENNKQNKSFRRLVKSGTSFTTILEKLLFIESEILTFLSIRFFSKKIVKVLMIFFSHTLSQFS